MRHFPTLMSHELRMLLVSPATYVAATLFLGFMGLLLVVAIVSGIVLYGPFTRRLAFGVVRTDGSRRRTWLDLHNLLGIVTLVWLVVVGATGVINTLAIPMYGLYELSIVIARFIEKRSADAEEDEESADAASAKPATASTKPVTGGTTGSATGSTAGSTAASIR